MFVVLSSHFLDISQGITIIIDFVVFLSTIFLKKEEMIALSTLYNEHTTENSDQVF